MRTRALFPEIETPVYIASVSADEPRQTASPGVLAAVGLAANALFWGGLMTPYNAASYPELAYLNAILVGLGAALALGGVAAGVMRSMRQPSLCLLCGTGLSAAVLGMSALLLAAVAFAPAGVI